MGWRYRKSVRMGGFRINLSKSGIGYSWGFPGYRITKTATGQTRTTYSIPGTGISHVSQNSNIKTSVPQNNAIQAEISEDNNISLTSESEVRSSSQMELVDKINSSVQKFNFTWLFAIALAILAVIFYPLALLFILLLPINEFFINRKIIDVDYELDGSTFEKYEKFIKSLDDLNNSQNLWLINNSQSLYTLNQRKANAGAGRLINRTALASPVIGAPDKKIRQFSIKPNEKTVMLKFAKSHLLFLPEMMLLKTGKNVVGLSYDNLTINSGTIRFIEDGVVPRDAVVVDYTWKYVNKNGSPDKRYSNNIKLPICIYGRMTLSSGKGLNIEIQTSNIQVSQDVKTAISIYTNEITCMMSAAQRGCERQRN